MLFTKGKSASTQKSKESEQANPNNVQRNRIYNKMHIHLLSLIQERAFKVHFALWVGPAIKQEIIKLIFKASFNCTDLLSYVIYNVS